MNLYHFFILLSLACFGKAGPLVAVVAVIAGEIAGDAAGAAVAGSSIAAAVGVGTSAIWYGSFVVIDGALFYGTAAAGAGALAAGGAAGGAVAAVTDKKKSASIMASISSASQASVHSKEASKTSKALLPSLLPLTDTGHGPVVHVSATASIKATNAKTGTPKPQITSALAAPSIPPPPGQPVSTLPPGNRPSGVPAGVPDYNFRLCQYDIITMGQNKQNLTFDNPSGYNLLVGNIPSTCMVLATVMLGDPALGPHPIPMGAASLQWNDIKPDTINLIRKGFGQPPR